jgi:hypothetical protein
LTDTVQKVSLDIESTSFELDKLNLSGRRQACLWASLIPGIFLLFVAQAAEQPDVVARDNGNDLLVVDCLLPGQVRQLGRRTTYVSARRAVKTTARECQIRGGEYAAYDRANLQTSLNVWLPQAKGGDPEAQTIVGEIYARGVGSQADYAAAAHWYRLAAAQGDTRAQINLGYLYENGLGVEHDVGEARNWYRKASGFDTPVELDPEMLTLDVAVQSENAAEIAALRTEVLQLREDSAALREELGSAQSRLAESEHQLHTADSAIAESAEPLNRSIQTSEPPIPDDFVSIVTLDALRIELDQRTQELADLNDLLAETRQSLAVTTENMNEHRASTGLQAAELEQAEAQIAELTQLSESMQQREMELVRKQENAKRLQREIQRLKASEQQHQQELAASRTDQAISDRALIGPTITMIEPALPGNRGIEVVRSDADPVVIVPTDLQSRQIVGRVTAPAGLLALTMNDLSISPNSAGVFTGSVQIESLPLPVSLVAVDQQGKVEKINFELSGAKVAATADTSDRDPARNIDFGQYYALIIGNNEYESLPDLQSAVNDATDLERLLREKYGFRTTLLLNASRYNFLSALNDMRENLTSSDNLLIYYAGHGELDRINMRGHWLPVDAEADSTANWLSNIAITDILNVMQAKQVLVVADSCYSGALTRSAIAQINTGMTEAERLNWIKTMTEKRSRMVFTSGGLAPVLDSGGGRNSVFTKALLDFLADNNELIEGQRLHREVAARVAYATTNMQFNQVPEYAPVRYAGHEAGDFFFVPIR